MASRSALGVLALSLAFAGPPAYAQDQVSEEARWEARPSQADFERLGPPDAVRAGQAGRATIDCALNATGRLRDCRVKAETPAGAGYGEAALRLAPYYKLARTQEVELEGSRLTFVVRFRYTAPVAATAVVADPPPASPGQDALAAAAAGITPPTGDLARIAIVPGWQTDLLDLGRTRREGDQAETYRVTVYAGARDGSPGGAYEVAWLRFDCAAGVLAVEGARIFDRTGAPVGWRAGSPGQPVAPDTVDALIQAAACGAGAGDGGRSTLAEALAEAGR